MLKKCMLLRCQHTGMYGCSENAAIFYKNNQKQVRAHCIAVLQHYDYTCVHSLHGFKMRLQASGVAVKDPE
jgi:hypothetical protein